MAISPERHTASRQLAGSDSGALTFAHAVRPNQLAGFSIQRDDRTARASSGVENTIDGQRGAFQFVFGPRAEIVGLEAPRRLELVEVGGVDLIQRRILGALLVGCVIRPVAFGR